MMRPYGKQHATETNKYKTQLVIRKSLKILEASENMPY